MKKFSLFLLSLFVSTVSFSASIGAPEKIDFGTYNIYGQEELMDSLEIVLNPSGISNNGISVEVIDDAEGIFWTSDTWLYANGTPDYYGDKKAKLYFYAIEAGTYTAKLRLTDYGSLTADVALSVTVVNEKPVVGTFIKVTSTSDLKDGDEIVLASEATPAVCGPLASTAMPFITENVTRDASAGTLSVPETAQTFTISKYSGNWQLTKTGSTQRLTMHIYTSGTKEMVELAYDGASSEGYYYTWNISFDSNGNATIARSGDTDYYIMINYMPSIGGNAFKPYNSNKTVYTTPYQIYKKKSEAAVESKFEVNPNTLVFGEVELSEKKSMDLTYAAEYLLADITWKLEGTDAGLFECKLASGNDRKEGTVTVNYKGNGTSTGAKTASLVYTTKDADDKELKGSVPVTITLVANTIHPTALAIQPSSPQDLVVGKTLQLSTVFTPSNTTNQGVIWTSNKPTIASVSESGLVTALKYDQYNNNVTITAKSKADETVTAQIVINVVQVPVTEVKLDKTEINLYIGGTETLTATVLPAEASQSVTWSSANNKIATVSAAGVVKAVALGEVKITVKSNANSAMTAVCTVHVIATPADNISFNPASVSVPVNGTLTLAPVVTPEQAAKDNEVTYSGYDEQIISISDGVVKGLKEGETTITATCGGKTATLEVAVTGQIWYTLVTNPATLKAGDKIVFARNVGDHKMIVKGWDAAGTRFEVETADVEFDAEKVAFEGAMVFTLQEGWKLENGGKTIGAKNNSDSENTMVTNKNDVFTLTADENGVLATNTTNSHKLQYNSSSKKVALYKNSNTSYPMYIYTLTPHDVPSAVEENAQLSNPTVIKMMKDGVLYILRDGVMYNIQGLRVD